MKFILFHITVALFTQIVLLDEILAQNSNQEAIAVIIHERIDTDEIDLDELLDIYTLISQQWDDNTRIRIADYKGSPNIRSEFYDALNTSSNNIKRIWLRAQFTGRSIPPKVVNTVEEMIEEVINNPGMIGYVPSSMVPSNVKVLLEIDD